MYPFNIDRKDLFLFHVMESKKSLIKRFGSLNAFLDDEMLEAHKAWRDKWEKEIKCGMEYNTFERLVIKKANLTNNGYFRIESDVAYLLDYLRHKKTLTE